MEAADTAAAIAEANRPDYGLVGYVAGGDLRGPLEAAQAIACGTVVVNGWRVVVPYAPMRVGAARAWAPSSAGRAWRLSCAGSTCASWPSPRAVHTTGEDELLELGPRARRAAVADPARPDVGVLVQRALG